MDFILHPVEVRVLGALLEKEITTPEYYPLTLNALVNACNQKSNRDPVVAYDEEAVTEGLDLLRSKKLAAKIVSSGSRVDKYAQRFSETFNLGRRELALLCVLMLRGPQTVGELRDRTERMHHFADLEEAESCLERLMSREPEPLVTKLQRQPGMKEQRYAHLLSGEVTMQPQAREPHAESHPASERIAALETEVAALRQELELIKERFTQFQKQFE
jgi:uncharacterized protein